MFSSKQNVKSLREEIGSNFFVTATYFCSKIVFKYSLSAIKCVSERVYCKKDIIPDNIMKAFNCDFQETFSIFFGLSCFLSVPKCYLAMLFCAIASNVKAPFCLCV